MIIKLNYPLGNVTLETPTNDPDKVFTPKITVDSKSKSDVEQIRKLLDLEFSESIGFYGHIFDSKSTTNLDLLAATNTLKLFTVESIEPMLTSPDIGKSMT